MSFSIETLLVVALLISYVVDQSPRHAGLTSPVKALDASRVVLPTLYWSSTLFSFGIIIASLKAVADSANGGQTAQVSTWSREDSTYNPYDTHLAAIASLLSAIPALIAGLLLQKSGRRRRVLNVIILPIL